MVDPIQADTFHLFALLPKEIRLQIWNLALEPRVIPLYRINDSVMGRGIFYPMRIAIAGFMALTTNHPSLDVLRHVCPEAKGVCQQRFMVLEIWDARKMGTGTAYDPIRDVVFFSHSIDASILLDFAAQHPMQASRLQALAIPEQTTSDRVSRKETLAALRAFDSLKEIIIVVGNTAIGEDNVSLVSAVGNEHWKLPRSAEEALEQLRNERWPDWRIPSVTVVRSQEDILSRNMAMWIE